MRTAMLLTRRYRGFTLVEIVTAIGIVVIVGSIGISTFYSAKKTKELNTTADGIVAELEHAKADAASGKNSQSFGVYFASSSYIYFVGSSYNASDSSNHSNLVFGDLKIVTTFPGNKAVFTHLTGAPQAAGTVTLSDASNANNSKTISVGESGDISVIR